VLQEGSERGRLRERKRGLSEGSGGWGQLVDTLLEFCRLGVVVAVIIKVHASVANMSSGVVTSGSFQQGTV
jgi:hypothetical protein